MRIHERMCSQNVEVDFVHLQVQLYLRTYVHMYSFFVMNL